MIVLLSACGPVRDKTAEAKVEAEKAAYANAEAAIPCELLGQTSFAPVCRIDRAYTQDGLFPTVRHPDGGFHRLLVTNDGRGVVAADGAETAEVTPIAAHQIEVAVVMGDRSVS